MRSSVKNKIICKCRSDSKNREKHLQMIFCFGIKYPSRDLQGTAGMPPV